MPKKEDIGYGIVALFIVVSLLFVFLMAPFEPFTAYAVAGDQGSQDKQGYASFGDFLHSAGIFITENFILLLTVFLMLALGIGGLIFFLIERSKASDVLSKIPKEQVDSAKHYIHSTMSKGFSKDDIKKALIDSGWHDDIADALLSHF